MRCILYILMVFILNFSENPYVDTDEFKVIRFLIGMALFAMDINDRIKEWKK